MSFAPENLSVRSASWPDVPWATWDYTIPDGETIEDVLAPGYFDTADPRLVPRSIIFVALPDTDGDGIAETVMLTVMSREPAVDDPKKPGKISRVAAAARAIREEISK